MSEQPKRKWFQFHLSTAIVVVLVAGVVLGFNIYVATLRPTVWESGLPICDWSRHSTYEGQLALHLPGVLFFNVGLNVGFCLMIGAIWEHFVRRKDTMAEDVDNVLEPKRSWCQIHLPNIMAFMLVSKVLGAWLLNVTGCKRPLFQIHLSTALVLMLLAGVLLWANLSVSRNILYSDGGGDAGGGCMENSTYVGIGWPLKCCFFRIQPTPNEMAYCELQKIPGELWKRYDSDTVVLRWNLALDNVAGVLVLAAFAVAVEWLVRRRETKL